jgi:8-oxo-dGTP diphosphatase
MKIKKFNIRVYGILINSKKQVLISDEIIQGKSVTKFPGGGLELGEGIIDCLKREFIEETNNEIEVIEHFYTTDYFQQSAYNKKHQIISIYYLVKPLSRFKLNSKAATLNTNEESFRWIDLKSISEKDFTLPIDKLVGKMLKQKYKTTK